MEHGQARLGSALPEEWGEALWAPGADHSRGSPVLWSEPVGFLV